MKKIISLFQRNYDGNRLVRDEVVPGAEWVTAGEGTATRKWDGTYELVGPKVQGNPEGFDQHKLIPHGKHPVDAPRSFAELREWFTTAGIEGVVWWHPDGRMVKIKAKDFGIKRTANAPADRTAVAGTVRPDVRQCEACDGTGWYGDNGPGIPGNGEFVRCDCGTAEKCGCGWHKYRFVGSVAWCDECNRQADLDICRLYHPLPNAEVCHARREPTTDCNEND